MRAQDFRAGAMCCAVAIGVASLSSVAGPLTPPGGPVAPTHKTLTEVEPRTAVSATNTPGDEDSVFRISQPGSYYLTGNIVGVANGHGIEIASDGVTLDLMGFDMQGAPLSLDGVHVSLAVENVRICNGSVRDWGGDGIDALDAANSSFHNLRLVNNGVNGLIINSGRIESCTAQSNANDGFFSLNSAVMNDIRAMSNGFRGIAANSGSTVTNASASGNGNGGIVTGSGATVSQATAYFNTGEGFSIGAGATVTCVTARDNTGDGISSGGGVTISDALVYANGGAGIVTGAGSTVIGAVVSFSSGIGISAGAGTQVVDCVANNNQINGIQLADNAVAIDCTAQGNAFDGIHCLNYSTVEGCTVAQNQRDGIRATAFDVTIRNCNAHHNQGIGINVNGAGCLAVGNYAHTNVTDYFFGGTGVFGPIVNGATVLTNTNPSANYEP